MCGAHAGQPRHGIEARADQQPGLVPGEWTDGSAAAEHSGFRGFVQNLLHEIDEAALLAGNHGCIAGFIHQAGNRPAECVWALPVAGRTHHRFNLIHTENHHAGADQLANRFHYMAGGGFRIVVRPRSG